MANITSGWKNFDSGGTDIVDGSTQVSKASFFTIFQTLFNAVRAICDKSQRSTALLDADLLGGVAAADYPPKPNASAGALGNFSYIYARGATLTIGSSSAERWAYQFFDFVNSSGAIIAGTVDGGICVGGSTFATDAANTKFGVKWRVL